MCTRAYTDVGRSPVRQMDESRLVLPGTVRGSRAVLTPEEQTDLISLTFHWDTAYRFEVVDGVWRATSHGDPSTVLTADTAWELRQLVRDDYAARTKQNRGYGGLSERMSS